MGCDFAFPFVIPLSHLFPSGNVQHTAKARALHGKENKVNGQECIFAHQKAINCYKMLGLLAFLI